jgi:tripartite-type tricarboxylate transporter receptor subunit TctC
MRHRFLTLLAAVAAVALSAGPTFAQSFPSRPVHGVVPYGSGGVTDSVARVVAQKLSEKWGKQLVIENRPGAGGNIGTDYVTKAAPDGYTINFATQALTINEVLLPSSTYKAMRDLAPVTLLGWSDNVLVVHPSLPAHTVPEFVAYAKANPGKLNYGGSSLQGAYAMEQLKSEAGITIERVEYKEITNLTTDLLAGRLQVYFTPIAAVLSHIQSGALAPLAVSADDVPSLPKVPSIKKWYPQVEAAAWYAVLVPIKTPGAIVAQLNADIGWALEQPDVRQRLATFAVRPAHTSPEATRRVLQQEIDRIQDLARRGIMKPGN